MIDLRPEDSLHKSYLNRILIEIVDNPPLSQYLAFKGGTAAAMLGYLDRFSVDLDFDLLDKRQITVLRSEFLKVYKKLDLNLVKEFNVPLFFQLRYTSNNPKERNTIKVSAHDLVIAANDYAVQNLNEIDRLMRCQTIETMFANKLVAITDRYKKHKTVAGRDVYDIHHFFTHGYKYKGAVIKERTGLDPKDYFTKLIEFMDGHINQPLINQDLNTLLPNPKYQQVRKVLIPETKNFLKSECQDQSRLV